MPPQTEYVSRTQQYLKVKKPMLERQRRARINKCLDQLKELVAEFQNSDAILRMDKAEMLECALTFIKNEGNKSKDSPTTGLIPMDSFRHGYMNAVNEVSRIMATTPDMNVQIGKSVMIHLGSKYNLLLQIKRSADNQHLQLSPASSGYHSDECEDDSTLCSSTNQFVFWRPW